MSSPMVLSGIAAVREAEGRHLGYSEWLEHGSLDAVVNYAG